MPGCAFRKTSASRAEIAVLRSLRDDFDLQFGEQGDQGRPHRHRLGNAAVGSPLPSSRSARACAARITSKASRTSGPSGFSQQHSHQRRRIDDDHFGKPVFVVKIIIRQKWPDDRQAIEMGHDLLDGLATTFDVGLVALASADSSRSRTISSTSSVMVLPSSVASRRRRSTVSDFRIWTGAFMTRKLYHDRARRPSRALTSPPP